MNTEVNQLVRENFKNDDAVLYVCSILGKHPFYPNAIKRIIIKERIVAMLQQGEKDDAIAKKNTVSEKTVYRVRKAWLKKSKI